MSKNKYTTQPLSSDDFAEYRDKIQIRFDKVVIRPSTKSMVTTALAIAAIPVATRLIGKILGRQLIRAGNSLKQMATIYADGSEEGVIRVETVPSIRYLTPIDLHIAKTKLQAGNSWEDVAFAYDISIDTLEKAFIEAGIEDVSFPSKKKETKK